MIEHNGLTKREFFAIHILDAIIQKFDFSIEQSIEETIIVTDMLLNALSDRSLEGGS